MGRGEDSGPGGTRRAPSLRPGAGSGRPGPPILPGPMGGDKPTANTRGWIGCLRAEPQTGGTGEASGLPPTPDRWLCAVSLVLVKCPCSGKHRATRVGSRAGGLGPGSWLGGQVAAGGGEAWLLKKAALLCAPEAW